jgi:hypothetical protein
MANMQRWVRLPQGGFIDANRVVYVGKPESFAKLDDEGNAVGTDFAVTIATSLDRSQQLIVNGSREEIAAFMRQLMGQGGQG